MASARGAAACSAPLPARAQIPSISGDSDAYVEALVDRTDPWQGQQITYTFRYYEAVDALRLPGILVGQPDYEAPDFANFWQEGEIEQTNYQQTIGDRTYNVSELHTVLFPTAAGPVTIPPAAPDPARYARRCRAHPRNTARHARRQAPPGQHAGHLRGSRGRLPPDCPGRPHDYEGGRAGDAAPDAERSGQRAPGPGAGPARPGGLARVLERGEDVRVEKAGGQIVGTRTLETTSCFPPRAAASRCPRSSIFFFRPGRGRLPGRPYRAHCADSRRRPRAASRLPPKSLPRAADADHRPDHESGHRSRRTGRGRGGRCRRFSPWLPPPRIPAARPPLAESPWVWALWLAPLSALFVGLAPVYAAVAQRNAAPATRRRAAADDALRLSPPGPPRPKPPPNKSAAPSAP